MIKPRALVGPDGTHHERVVVFPAPDRIAVPPWIRILWQRTAVGPDHAPPLLEHVEDQDLIRCLHDLEGTRFVHDETREPCWIADGREWVVDVRLVDGTRSVAWL